MPPAIVESRSFPQFRLLWKLFTFPDRGGNDTRYSPPPLPPTSVKDGDGKASPSTFVLDMITVAFFFPRRKVSVVLECMSLSRGKTSEKNFRFNFILGCNRELNSSASLSYNIYTSRNYSQEGKLLSAFVRRFLTESFRRRSHCRASPLWSARSDLRHLFC